MLVLGRNDHCYDVRNKDVPTGCTGDPLPSVAAKEAVAPFLYGGGLTPTLNAAREPLHLLLRHLNQVSPC